MTRGLALCLTSTSIVRGSVTWPPPEVGSGPAATPRIVWLLVSQRCLIQTESGGGMRGVVHQWQSSYAPSLRL